MIAISDPSTSVTPQSNLLAHTEVEGDLDLLDDEQRHACCLVCYPDRRPGLPFVALCGRHAIGFRGESEIAPPNACPACAALYGRCPRSDA